MIKQWIADMLNPIAGILFSLVMVVPMSVVRVIFIGILVVLALWVISMPGQYPEGGKKKLRDDLRFFALGVLLLQAMLYLIF